MIKTGIYSKQNSKNRVRNLLVVASICCCLLFGFASFRSPLPESSRLAAYPTSDVEAVDYFGQIALLRSQLKIAQELIEHDQIERVSEHIGTPIDQIYASLNQHVTWQPSFLISLFNLRDLLSQKSFSRKPLLAAQVQRVFTALDSVSQSPETQRWQSLSVLLRVIEQQMLQVGHNYRSSVQQGQIVNLFRFETARGLVVVSEEFFKPLATQLREVNPVLASRMESALSSIRSVVSSSVPDSTKLTDAQSVDRAIADFVEASQRMIAVS